MVTKKEYKAKIVVAGDGGVGKTSLLNRYVSDTFMEVMKITIGTGFFAKVLETEDSIVSLQLWDFGGEKRFRFILPSYCKGAHGVILAFDMNDFTTLMNLDEWLQIIRENTKDPAVILVGTKSDIAGVFDDKFIQDYLKKNNLEKFFPTSAKTGENVDRVFEELVHDVLASKTLE
jgi:small GTP-binding protein